MFNKPGEKLRKITTAVFVVEIIFAIFVLYGFSVEGDFFAGLVYAAMVVLLAWSGCVSMMALSVAAESAENAEFYAKRALNEVRRLTGGKTKTPNGESDEKVPAWKAVQEKDAKK